MNLRDREEREAILAETLTADSAERLVFLLCAEFLTEREPHEDPVFEAAKKKVLGIFASRIYGKLRFLPLFDRELALRQQAEAKAEKAKKPTRAKRKNV